MYSLFNVRYGNRSPEEILEECWSEDEQQKPVQSNVRSVYPLLAWTLDRWMEKREKQKLSAVPRVKFWVSDKESITIDDIWFQHASYDKKQELQDWLREFKLVDQYNGVAGPKHYLAIIHRWMDVSEVLREQTVEYIIPDKLYSKFRVWLAKP